MPNLTHAICPQVGIAQLQDRAARSWNDRESVQQLIENRQLGVLRDLGENRARGEPRVRRAGN